MPRPYRPSDWRLSRRHFLRLVGAGASVALPLAAGRTALAQPESESPSGLPSTPIGVGSTGVAPAAPPAPPDEHDPVWVQALRPLALWSGPDGEAKQLGVADRWDYFQVVQSQRLGRLYVLVARTQNYAWVDALAVGPSGPPPEGWPPADLPPPPPDLSLGWLATVVETPLWAGPGADVLLGLVPAWTAVKQIAPQDGPRILVQDPYSDAAAYVDAVSLGPIEPPRRLAPPGRWWGIVAVDGANLRSQPTTRGSAVGQLPHGSPIVVSGWVEGEQVIKDNPTWAVLGDGAYLYSSVLRPVALPLDAPRPPRILSSTVRWIDLNLTHQVMVAYEGDTPVHAARTSTGRPGWETDTGVFHIGRRVEKETMDSSTLVGRDAERASYRVENIRWTQYFTDHGQAIHENYWKPRDEFGIPSSHGCAGLVAEEARYFWDFASLGTQIYAHY